MKELIFVRHGESFANLEGKYGGHSMVELTEKGKEQAQNISELLVGKNITKIICSDLIRAKQTAEIINKKLNLEIEYLKNLREIDYGKLTMMPKIKGVRSIKYLFENKIGENEDDIIKRANKIINLFKNIKLEGSILIVGHNTFTATIFYVLEKQNKNMGLIEYRKQWNMKNGEAKKYILK